MAEYQNTFLGANLEFPNLGVHFLLAEIKIAAGAPSLICFASAELEAKEYLICCLLLVL